MFTQLRKLKHDLRKSEATSEAKYIEHLISQYEAIGKTYSASLIPLNQNCYHVAASKVSVLELAGEKLRSPKNGDKLLRSCYHKYVMAGRAIDRAEGEPVTDGERQSLRLDLQEARYVLASLLDSILETTLLIPAPYQGGSHE